jgi:hypothetical protein
MKDYSRFLFFSGVEFLPASEKKVYRFEKIKEEKRLAKL